MPAEPQFLTRACIVSLAERQHALIGIYGVFRPLQHDLRAHRVQPCSGSRIAVSGLVGVRHKDDRHAQIAAQAVKQVDEGRHLPAIVLIARE